MKQSINKHTYTKRLHKLFESAPEDRFLTLQKQTLDPLQRVDNEVILNSIVDPTTGEPYDGIVLQGVFADMDVLNNNGRKYVEENYLEFVEILKYQIHSPRGVYGELEHPQGYNVNYNNISHKILDIWYNREDKKVYGIILLLNTEKGKIAQEVVKSGGQLAVSARGGGSEDTNPDGTISAVLKLLVTYDIVYHPGFSNAIVDIENLYENEEINIYEPQIGKLNELYESYNNNPNGLINLNESQDFYSWINKDSEIKMLLESQKQQSVNKQQKQQQVLQKQQSSDEDVVEDKLQKVVDQDLSEEEQLMQDAFKRSVRQQQKWLKKRMANNAYYTDNTAGFVDNSANYQLGDSSSTTDI